jgi:hypothetical protein
VQIPHHLATDEFPSRFLSVILSPENLDPKQQIRIPPIALMSTGKYLILFVDESECPCRFNGV